MSTFYFDGVASNRCDLEIGFESSESIQVESICVRAYPDVIIREFENGLVLANPSSHPWEFPLDKLVPGRNFRRLRGKTNQDPFVNNGQSVGKTLTLNAKDAIFLVAGGA